MNNTILVNALERKTNNYAYIVVSIVTIHFNSYFEKAWHYKIAIVDNTSQRTSTRLNLYHNLYF